MSRQERPKPFEELIGRAVEALDRHLEQRFTGKGSGFMKQIENNGTRQSFPTPKKPKK